MIVIILYILLFLIFIILGGFHFYWLFGGNLGLGKVIPTKDNEARSTLSIPKLATIIVGLAFVLFGLIYLIKSELINAQVPNWLTNYGYWFIPSIFILRAIGEFKYVGFFKKIKHTECAKADSKMFSPLCLGIGLIGVLIQLMDK